MKFLKELFSNPDGTGSTKRTAGWLLIAVSTVIAFIGLFNQVNNFDVIYLTMMSAALSCFGLSSVDVYSLKNKIQKEETNEKTEPNTFVMPTDAPKN